MRLGTISAGAKYPPVDQNQPCFKKPLKLLSLLLLLDLFEESPSPEIKGPLDTPKIPNAVTQMPNLGPLPSPLRVPYTPPKVSPMKTKSPAKAQAKVTKVMREFKAGELHSGSKSGPTVTSRKQAVAIAMSEAGKSKSKRK